VISEQAKKGFNQIFTRAARANLTMEPADTIAIEALASGPIVETPENRIVVLTVASYRFRLLTLFHVGSDKATADYFTRSDPGRVFAEVFSEKGNLCCGAMNRDLGKHFLHTGMSTPYLLDSQCIPFLKELKPSHVAQHRIAINGSVVMHASLCLCAYAPIDFRVDTESAQEATGELELF
jgi:hypothetical protein